MTNKEWGHKYFPENVKMVILDKLSPCKLDVGSNLYCESFLFIELTGSIFIELTGFQTIFIFFIFKNGDNTFSIVIKPK